MSEPVTIDTQEEKLRSDLLIFACAFMNFAVMFWLAIYWMMGQNYSTNVPLAYQAVSFSSLLIYLKTRQFEIFRFVQLSLFLFAPFVMQWGVGSSVTSSGVTLWALLAPVGARWGVTLMAKLTVIGMASPVITAHCGALPPD